MTAKPWTPPGADRASDAEQEAPSTQPIQVSVPDDAAPDDAQGDNAQGGQPEPDLEERGEEPHPEPGSLSGPHPDPHPDPTSRGSRRRRVLVWTAAVAAAFVVLYVGVAWALADRVPRQTTVAGVSVGGLDRAAAEQRLVSGSREVGKALPVSVSGKTVSLDVAAAGLSVDARATVRSLTGFSLSPARLWRHASAGGDHPAVPSTSNDRLEPVLQQLAGSVRRPARDAAITFTGARPTLTPAVIGSELDIAGAASLIRRSWLGGVRPLQLPATERQPAVTQAEAEEALTELATPALAGPLTVKVGDRAVVLPPDKVAPALAVKPGANGVLALAVDGTKLQAVVLAAAPQIATAPKDARIEFRGGRPVVIPSKDGVTLDPAALAAAAPKALGAVGPERSIAVTTSVRKPKLTTEQANALGVKERVSTFSTILTADSRRTENLRIAARTVNGTLVLPGEVFSLNQVLGERTPAKGYNQAPAISNGRLVRDYGGGVSQMATTIFNNVFFAGLEDIYHKPHSFYISRYPEGREATVNWPGVDLKWRNDSKYAVLIQASVGNRVNVSFWSTKTWDIDATKSGRSNYRSPDTVYDDGPGCVAQAAQSGFDVSVQRLFKRGGRVVKTETFSTAYIAEDRVVCGPKPKTAEPDAN